MLPPKTNESFTYVLWADVLRHHPEKKRQFAEFMSGQTCGVVDGGAAVYYDDYERWVRQNYPSEQAPHDWD